MAAHLMMLLLHGGPGVASPGIEVEYLVVASGGGGGFGPETGFGDGGGGGAGGLLSGSLTLARGTEIAVTVGDYWQDSTLGELTAIRGGGGGSFGEPGGNGGSGGGGGGTISGTTAGGAGTSGQGGNGGAGDNEGASAGGSLVHGDRKSSITGEEVIYASGGAEGGFGAGFPEQPANTGNGGHGGKVVAGTGIVVSGAGTSAANGIYAVSGTSFLDSPQYRLGSTNYYIRNDGSSWNIVEDSGTPSTLYSLNSTPVDAEFYNPFTGPYPEGPAAAANGASPTPTIEVERIVYNPQSGASGVVVIAYPDTLPALTVSNGLTFTQPTRAGYRVYRFTGGTGTVTMP